MAMTFIGLITINILKPRLTVENNDIDQLIGHLIKKKEIREGQEINGEEMNEKDMITEGYI